MTHPTHAYDAPWSAADLPRWHRKGVRHKMPLHVTSMYCAVRIIGDVLNRSTRQIERRAIGTGFFITVASETVPDLRTPYLVTAHHVVVGQSNIEIQLPHPRTGRLSAPVPVTDWWQPLDGVDLALAKPARYSLPHLFAIELEHLVLKDDEPPELLPGSIVYYIGLLAPDDRVMARSGTIGALDQTDLDFKEGYRYPAHLVDCRSYGGFSGSPCFVDLPYAQLAPVTPPSPRPPGAPPVGEVIYGTMLCGMFTAHRTDENEDGTVSRYGVGVMLRSKEIRKALMTEELRRDRAREDAEYEAERAAKEPGFENARTGGSTEDEFVRFEDLTRRLVNVPKKELDEKRKDES